MPRLRGGLVYLRWYEIKQRCPDRLVFVQVGDFYRTFGESARTVALVCDLPAHDIRIRGGLVPVVDLQTGWCASECLTTLTDNGYAVAVADAANLAGPVGIWDPAGVQHD